LQDVRYGTNMECTSFLAHPVLLESM